MWTNKQHIMSRLSEDHRVLHVDYGFRWLPIHLFDHFRREPSDLLRPWRALTEGVTQRSDSLWVAQSYGPPPLKLLPHNSPLRYPVEHDFKLNLVRRFMEREGFDDPLLWIYHPAFAEAVDDIPHSALIYDCVDNYPAFPNYHHCAEWLADVERRLCQRADLVLTTSQELYDTRAPYNPENTHLVHNVGDAEHFKQALDPDLEVPDDIADLDGPVVGFVGAVSDYKLDSDWLIAAADAHPEWDVVVIGPVGLADPSTEVSQLQQRENVHLLGYRDYADLPAHLKGFDLAVIPYRINEYTRSVFPIKFFEFLATGTPVVISALPALEEYWEAVRTAETAEAFVAECEAALTEEDENRDERIRLAEENSWASRIEEIMRLIEERLDER
ncbi:MAG: glycosyltransferase [Bradymonadaceae bacterium]